MNYQDDILHIWLGTATQIDGLAHLGEAGYFYNCNSEQDVSSTQGVLKLSTHNIPPFVARGVVLNMAEYKGVEYMDAGEWITADDIIGAANAQNVILQEGDVITFYTGWTEAKLISDPDTWVGSEPGLDNDACRYLAEEVRPLAVGADTWGVEVFPAKPGDLMFYGHTILLKEKGIYILETLDLGPLVDDNVTEYLFVLGQALVKGTVQMIINPVALW